MKLHILETFTDGHVIKGDINYVVSPFMRCNWIEHTDEFRSINMAREFNESIVKWLSENKIPQDPREWSESDLLRFQLRFG